MALDGDWALFERVSIYDERFRLRPRSPDEPDSSCSGGVFIRPATIAGTDAEARRGKNPNLGSTTWAPSQKFAEGNPRASSRKVQSLQANTGFYGTELHPTSPGDRTVVHPVS